jgi:CDP-glucose 4,6-dehydratase
VIADREFWSGRRVLITGHTGFKGAWLATLLRGLGAEVSGFALAPEGPSGAFAQLDVGSRVCSQLGDIRDREAVRAVLARHRPEIVFHLAAQALVRRGFADPVGTFDVNVTGTAVVLAEAAESPSVRTVLVVTSDKVYANDGAGRPFVESDPLGGGDPYSASKAAAEMVVSSWRHSFVDGDGPTVITARAGNVIGGGDGAPDRLIPDLFRSLAADRPLLVRHPGSTRPWQFVLEPLFGYLAYARAAWDEGDDIAAALNFGPGLASCWTVQQVADGLIERCGTGSWERVDVTGEPEATMLRLDASLAERTIGWKPSLDLATALDWTVAWWRAEQVGDSLEELAMAQIERYEELVAP